MWIRAVLVVTLAAAAGCSTPRAPAPRGPILVEDRRPAPAPLPDELERTAARLAALVLAGRPDSAAASYQALKLLEGERRREGAEASGLEDNARDLLHTLSGPDAYDLHSARMLDEDDLDPVLRRRLEDRIDQHPLHVAERRLQEHRRARLAAVFNRLIQPLSSLATMGYVNPLAAGRAAISTLRILKGFPDVSVQERQALRAYQEFLKRHPESPEAAQVSARVERYSRKKEAEQHREAVRAAQRALAAGQPEVALAHLGRAQRLRPADPHARRLTARTEQMITERTTSLASALAASDPVGRPASRGLEFETNQLLAATLVASAEEIAARAQAAEKRLANPRLSDELAFLQLRETLERNGEDPYFDAVRKIAREDPERSNMARHARWILADPEQDPYVPFARARRADRSERLRYVFLGRYRRGPPRRELSRPLEWLLSAPGMVVAAALTPVRLLQYGSVRPRFGTEVIEAGVRYLRRFPEGAHASEVHRELESLYAARERWTKALHHHGARASTDPETIALYRERAARQALEAARLERRWDVRMQLYAWVQRDYADTPEAAVAGRELAQLLKETTPQSIRLSRAFLLENPDLWGPEALALREELFDDEAQNGEITDEGVTLIGQTRVQITLEGTEPVVEVLSEARFSRLIALLEETYYRRLATDERERPELDPQRDLFFERARLGLLDRPDARPTAASDATFLSTREKHGPGRRASLLPVELVVAGDLENFGLSAFPRIRPPAETEDAWLYR